MKRSRFSSWTIGALCSVCVTLNAGPAHAITSSFSGKTLALYSEMALLSPGPYTATILKGKKKNVLVIDVTISRAGTQLCINSVTVNGLLANPTTGAVNVVCTGVTTEFMSQTISATYWLDIDQAETASPGGFYNVPLNVAVAASSDGGGQSASIVVRMEKK